MQLPILVREIIRAISIYLNDQIPGGFTLKGNLDGIYTAKASYKWLMQWPTAEDVEGSWKWIWCNLAPKLMECTGSVIKIK
jgi:hypothetical protein